VGFTGLGFEWRGGPARSCFYLPEVQTDFIFANICEELGLIGALAGGWLVCRGWGIAGCGQRFLFEPIQFARFLAFGLLQTAILIQGVLSI